MIDFDIGDETILKRAFSQFDFDRFAALSGDDNPIHVDPQFAAKSRFGRTVCHGMLLYSGLAGTVSQAFQGAAVILVASELMFPSPAYADEELEFRLAVEKSERSTRATFFKVAITRPGGQAACQGKLIAAQDPGLLGQVRIPAPDPVERGASELKGLRLGQEAITTRTFTVFDLAEYVTLVGDRNPLHREGEAAQDIGLGGLMIPAGLIGGMFSDLLGTKLPGRGTAWLKQRINFVAPAHPGQLLSASVAITRLRPEKNLANLSTYCVNPNGEIICSGEALVLVSDLAERGAL